jgi:hypothetical protein
VWLMTGPVEKGSAPGAWIKPLWCDDHQTRYRLGPSATLPGFSTGPAVASDSLGFCVAG